MKMMPITGDQFDILVEQGADFGAFFENALIPDHVEDSPEALLEFIASEHHEVSEPVVREVNPAVDKAVLLTTGNIEKRAKPLQGMFRHQNLNKSKKIFKKAKKARTSSGLYLETANFGYDYNLIGRNTKK